MKFLLFLLPFSVLANTFELKDTGARFTLLISPESVFYHSESLDKRLVVRDCNRSLAIELNTEIFSLVQESTTGLKFRLDKNDLLIDPTKDEGKRLLAMDSRIQQFLVEENKRCP